jgi:hypothetical protein
VLTAARRAGMTARRPARHPGRWRSRLTAGLAGLAGYRVGPRRGAGVLAASGLSVLGEAGLPAASFGMAGTPVPWRGLMLACAASQLGGTLVPLPLVRARDPDAARAILTRAGRPTSRCTADNSGASRHGPWTSAFSNPHH